MRSFLIPLLILGCACTGSDAGRTPEAGEATTGYYLTLNGGPEGSTGLEGRVAFTDPAGGSPRVPTVGETGLRFRLTGAGGDPATGLVVRVVYRRHAAEDARAFVAIEAPWEPGVYLGTLHLRAPGEWRMQVTVLDGDRRRRGTLAFTVPDG